MFKKLKDKKGFTLVELIVVLVILAILAALLIPALTGYIDKANKEKVVAETRMVVMAAQVEGTDYYKNGYLDVTAATGKNGPKVGDIIPLAEVSALGTVADGADGYAAIKPTSAKAYFKVTYDKAGKVLGLQYDNGVYFVEYADGAYKVGKKSDNISLKLEQDDVEVATSYTAVTFTKELN